MEYNNCNGSIWWKISKYLQKSYLSIVLLSPFSSYSQFIHFLKFVILKMYVNVLMYNVRSGIIRWHIPDFLSDCNSNVSSFPMFTSHNSHLKSLTLKIKVKIMKYNIRMVHRWQISTSIKVVLKHFSLTAPFSRCSHFKLYDLENIEQGHDVQHL